MKNESHPVRSGKVAPLKVVVLVGFAVAVGAVMALTGQNRPRPCGCCPGTLGQASGGSCSTMRAERIVAFYFHRKDRCPSCESIEAGAKEAVEAVFSAQLQDGRLQWRSVDYEESGNEHYVTDYKIEAPCLVLVKMKDDKAVEWRSLPEVWQFVTDRPALVKFVQRNVQEFLDYIAIPGACCT
jgi:hypothetical protein